MNRPSILQFTVALGIIALGAAGVIIYSGYWEAGLITAACGILSLAILSDRAAPPTAQIVAQPEPVAPPDILDYPELDMLIEGVGDPVLIADKGKVVRANRAALRLLGRHIIGEDARIAIRHPAAAERLTNPAPMAEPVSINLTGIGTRDTRWEMRIAQLAAGKRVVQLINRSDSHAAERMRVDFVANASHELRTPLAGILGFIETLADPNAGGDKETRERFLNIMEGEARRMQRLVDDLMSLSRVEAEKFRAPDARVDLGELVAEVVNVFRQSHAERGRDVSAEIEAGLPPVVGDRAQLSQLLHNLVSNSAKYGRPGTPISVSLNRGTSGMARLTVADEGEGIAPDHLPRLTERFYRVDSGRSRAMGGTGLGLAIVKHIVERHRGRLDIASIVGKGTTITVQLPFAEAPEKQAKAAHSGAA